MLLALNIGNYAVNLGVFDGKGLVCAVDIGTDRAATADEYAMRIRSALGYKGIAVKDVTEAAIASVVPVLTERIEKAVTGLFGIAPLTVRPGVKTGFKIRLNDPTELGADIAANAAGAIAECGAPVIICDVGAVTAVTAVDGDKAFLGGALLPGIGMSLSALSDAALLPSVGFFPPRSPLGKSTVECMNAGVIYGQAAAVRELVSAYAQKLSSDKATVVLTGEHSEKLIPYLNINAVHIPSLTLKGLAAIADVNKSQKKK